MNRNFFHWIPLSKIQKTRSFKNDFFGGGSLIQIEPLTKRLEFEPQAKRSKVTDINEISSVLDSEAAIWYRVHWRLLEEQFLFWYLWLKDNFEEMKAFVQEVKTAAGEVSDDSGELNP